ncbi:hypothetical protein KCU62_g9954, partial [Aureobasidium sp. EXF-3399]
LKINPTILSLAFGLLVEGLPTDEQSRAIRVRRQDIDFDLADNSADPVVAPDNSTDYNQQAAIQEVKNDIFADPLTKRDIIVSTSSGYTPNVQLNGAAINAPLNCNGADTFMGSKLFNKGPFDTDLCATACRQAFSTPAIIFMLTVLPALKLPTTLHTRHLEATPRLANSTTLMGSWDLSYATNNGQWRGPDHYTIDMSYISSNTTNSGDVSCPSDVSYLSTAGAAFCSAYIRYQPPVSTVVSVTTPATSVFTSVVTSFTITTTYGTEVDISSTTTTVTSKLNAKRDGTVLATPASISTWSPSRISKACSAVATGSTTTSTITTASTPYSTFVTTQPATTISTFSTTTTTTAIATTTVAPVNLIKRGGFEGGTSDQSWQLLPRNGGWRIYDDPCNAHSGDYYLVLGSTGSQWNNTIQTVYSDSNKLYTVSFAYSYDQSNLGCSIQSSYGGIGIYSQNLIQPSNGWAVVNVPNVRGISNGANLEIDIFCPDPTVNGLLSLDDVSWIAQ